MVKPFRLAYADFASKDIEKLTSYYTEVMGYQLTEKAGDGSVYLSNGLDHHNIVVTPANFSGIDKFGYQLNGTKSLSEVQKELKKYGVTSELKTDAQPGVPEILELKDPENNIIQLFNEIDQSAKGYGKSGIVPLKLGHIAFYAKNAKKTIDFYKEALNFWFTDKIDEDFANFLTCNSDHHTLNIVSSKNKSKLHHIAFQLKDANHQYLSSDVLAQHDIPVLWGPSRHTSGHNIATYHYDSDQNVVELYIDMDVYIPELNMMEPRPWHKELPVRPKVWEGLSSWGTEFEFDLGKI